MKKPSSKPLKADDLHVWALYSQTVRPLPGRFVLAPPPTPPPNPPASAAPVVAPASPKRRAVNTHVTIDTAPAGLDRSSWLKFKSGKMRAEQKLDLHGMTAARAHHAVIAFLHRAHDEGARCVEIVTGRGGGAEGGVLKREFPLWLNLPALRPLILAACHPHQANTGAVRVLLRRER